MDLTPYAVQRELAVRKAVSGGVQPQILRRPRLGPHRCETRGIVAQKETYTVWPVGTTPLGSPSLPPGPGSEWLSLTLSLMETLQLPE